jgi:hypothetical protein
MHLWGLVFWPAVATQGLGKMHSSGAEEEEGLQRR